MKKINVLMLVLTIAAGCSQPAAQHTKPMVQKMKTCKYICIMDKDICADKPGICPKCGMQMVKKADK